MFTWKYKEEIRNEKVFVNDFPCFTRFSFKDRIGFIFHAQRITEKKGNNDKYMFIDIVNIIYSHTGPLSFRVVWIYFKYIHVIVMSYVRAFVRIEI